MKIYHYTSAEGLINILKNKTLWSTHFSYLNDKSEYLHAKEIILQAAEDIENEDVKKHKNVLESCLNQIYNIYDIYTCSFSKNPNLLSQWRSYCPKDGGFSIGFESKELMKINGENFYDCVYTYNDKFKLVKPVIIEFCQNVEKITKGIKLNFPDYWEQLFEKMDIKPYTSKHLINPLDLEKNHIYIRYELAVIAARMKDEAFIEENEFRFIYVVSNMDVNEIKFRNNNSLIIPFREITFNKSTIKSVHIGPSLNQNQNYNSIRMIKDSVNLEYEVIKSKIPYRGW